MALPVATSGDLVQFHVRGIDELLRKMETVKVELTSDRLMKAGCLKVISNVKTKQLAHQSGPPLPDKLTARHGGAGISGSIGFEISSDGQTMIGHIGVGANSPAAAYGHIHEYGGTIPHPGGRREQMMGGAAVSVMPERPYLRPGLEAAKPDVYRIWHEMVWRACQKAGLA